MKLSSEILSDITVHMKYAKYDPENKEERHGMNQSQET